MGQNYHICLWSGPKGLTPPAPLRPASLTFFCSDIMGPQKGNPTSQIETICCFITSISCLLEALTESQYLYQVLQKLRKHIVLFCRIYFCICALLQRPHLQTISVCLHWCRTPLHYKQWLSQNLSHRKSN